MKKIKLAILAFAFLGLAGCSKTESPTTSGSNTNTGGNTTPTYYFTCKVNGVATDFKAMTLIKDVADNPQMLFLVGQKSATELPSLTFTLNFKGSGWVDGLTYVLDEKDFDNFVEYKNVAQLLFKSKATPASANTGLTVVFDKIILPKDQYASGTFHGTLQLEENTTTVQITEGKFKVQFLN
ncbi:MAG: hypothetical protein CFE21_14285 [Bacteroidetes bacterium B1(2017)]|nr:MAG: hypothetical protein CFE21_14285 [Bacteroidetes bacterium B1(2017)]